jgi:hypothetical protein
MILASIHSIIVFSQVEEQYGKELKRQTIQKSKDIQILLNKILHEYKAQNYTWLEEIATKTYLGNYEYKEEPLGKKNKALMVINRTMLRDLPAAIDDKSIRRN